MSTDIPAESADSPPEGEDRRLSATGRHPSRYNNNSSFREPKRLLNIVDQCHHTFGQLPSHQQIELHIGVLAERDV